MLEVISLERPPKPMTRIIKTRTFTMVVFSFLPMTGIFVVNDLSDVPKYQRITPNTRGIKILSA